MRISGKEELIWRTYPIRLLGSCEPKVLVRLRLAVVPAAALSTRGGQMACLDDLPRLTGLTRFF